MGGGDGGAAGCCCISAARTSVMTTTVSLVWARPNLPQSSALRPAPYTVTGSQNLDVMALVAGNHERDRAHTDRRAVRRAAAPPGVGVERAEQGERPSPHGAQLTDEIGERARVEPGDRHVGVLVESGQRRRVAAPDPQRAISHD